MSLPNPYESPKYDPSNRANLGDEPAELPEHEPAAAAEGENLEPLHYGLWFLCAVAICFPQRWEFTSSHWFAYLGLYFLLALAPAGGVAAIILAGLRWHQKRPTYPVHFGHWLLLMFGTSWLSQRAFQFLQVQAIRMSLNPDPDELIQNPEELLPRIGLALTLGATAVTWLAIRYVHADKPWQRFAIFALIAVWWVTLIRYFGLHEHWMIQWITVLISCLQLGTFVIAAVRDVLRPEGRDQLHWLGIAWLPLTLIGAAMSNQLFILGR